MSPINFFLSYCSKPRITQFIFKRHNIEIRFCDDFATNCLAKLHFKMEEYTKVHCLDPALDKDKQSGFQGQESQE